MLKEVRGELNARAMMTGRRFAAVITALYDSLGKPMLCDSSGSYITAFNQTEWDVPYPP
jgi:hypothetical protein